MNHHDEPGMCIVGRFHLVNNATGVCARCGWDSIGEDTRRARAALPEILIAVLRREGTRLGEGGWWLLRIAELADALDVDRLARLSNLAPDDFEGEEALLGLPSTTDAITTSDELAEYNRRDVLGTRRARAPIQPRPDFEPEAVRRAKRGRRRSHPRYPLPDDLDDLPFEDDGGLPEDE